MSIPENIGTRQGRLLFYNEMHKLRVPDRATKGIDIAQLTGESRNCLWHIGIPAKYSRDNEHLMYGYR